MAGWFLLLTQLVFEVHVLVCYNRTWLEVFIFLFNDLGVLWDLIKVESRLESVQESLFHQALLMFIRLKSVTGNLTNLGRGNMLYFDDSWTLAGIPSTTSGQARLRFVKSSVLKIL